MNAGAGLLIYLIKAFLLAKRFLAAFFVLIVARPSKIFLRFFFYKIVVKSYCQYFKLTKRLGFKGLDQSFYSYLFNQKFVHILIIFFTATLIFVNLTTKTRAGGLTDTVHNTIISDLIKSEFQFEEDERLIVETFDQESVISAAQQHYLDNLSAMRPQPRVNMNEEAEDDNDLPTIQGGMAMVKPEIASTNYTKRERTETVEYTVKPGDTVSTIAEEYEISVSTILWENNLTAYSMIRPGDKLRILPTSGINHKVARGESLGVIAGKYDIDESEIIQANSLPDAASLQVGQNLLIPGGRKIVPPAPAPVVKKYTGISAIKDIVTTAPSAAPVAGNKMNWPTQGSRITQYYSWRHQGLDVANKTGTPIYAADAGTIEYVGWGTGYGNQIVVNHGGGKKTRYAHLSRFSVTRGQRVSKGQTIGLMGNTGWSTGPHLHFEVIINGTKYNPLNYIR